MQESAERRQVGQGMERGQGFKRTQDAKMASFSFFGLNSSRLPHTTPKVKTLVKW